VRTAEKSEEGRRVDGEEETKTLSLSFSPNFSSLLHSHRYSSSKLSPDALWLLISWIASSRTFQVFSVEEFFFVFF